ncbi:probable phosphorylase b kinase regulatory subunit alpha isoform X3 [Hydra vulgaris]|uniref:Phosphorylase b kinase regulatory subunit n=1 Tax=Hydra vulgaris TaxID=6087 RepID=A0ABM4CZ46_HYDVU
MLGTKPLDNYYNLVKKTILNFQHPVSGLFPASLYRAQFSLKHEYSDAWIRDNVYSILPVWALALAYGKTGEHEEEKSRQYELHQSVIKLMRALLRSMMQQVDKVERFKRSQKKEDSLHAKYCCRTGKTVVGDHDWGHLQIDAVSLYLLILAQMTASGLQIVYTKDEVDFVQNLVFYIETAYLIPDFGIWERGDKTNRGVTELNASSVGMAKAALEAMDELDVFGSRGSPESVIHVLADQIQGCKAVLQSMLPRESLSKECGASLLSIISFPAFAVEDINLINTTKSEIITMLQGFYGCKRFLRDGYHCENEDRFRLHYELHELSKFEHIECEWPLFFCFLVLDGVYNSNINQVETYLKLLEPLIIKSADQLDLLPELFYVPKDKIEQEKEVPHSQTRFCGDRLPHLWTQSLYILGKLLHEGFVAVGELDPLNRHYITSPKPELVIQVALIAEDEEIKELLTKNGVISQTVKDAEPIRILPARCLSKIYSRLGKNRKLGLSGRPRSSIGVIGIGSLYRADGNIYAFTPEFLDYRQFYMCLDNELLVDSLKTDLEYFRNNWRLTGRPTLTIPITHSLLEDSMSSAAGRFILQVTSGYLYSVRIRVGKLSEMLSRSSIKNLDFVKPKHFADIIRRFPDPTVSPRPGEVLKNYDDSVGEQTVYGGSMSSLDHSIYGSVARSRNLSRAASWTSATSFGSASDEEECSQIVQRFVFDTTDCQSSKSSNPPEEKDEVDIDEIRTQLEQTDDICAQADILHYLNTTKGFNYDIKLYGIPGFTVSKLLEELYEKACHMKLWSLVRHTSGMLKKTVQDLSQVCTVFLVNQKHIGIGLPHLHFEEIIKQPLPQDELKSLIYRACGDDSSAAVLTQEMLTYLSMFLKTDPSLFSEMLQIRVGLIMEVLAAEYARASGLSGEEAADDLLSLSPFQMKSLMYFILSGKEFGVEQEFDKSVVFGIERKGSMQRVRTAVKKVGEALAHKNLKQQPVIFSTLNQLQPTFETMKTGMWLRRRCLDGALNRVPKGFYHKVWHVLLKSRGMAVYPYGFFLEDRLTQENTPGEMKFALKVEEELNKILFPEYRQLVVEAMIIVSQLFEHHDDFRFNDVIQLNTIVSNANQLFLEKQKNENGDATLCCVAKNRPTTNASACGASNQICRYFYDSAPSGEYGTLTYLAQASFQMFYKHMQESNEFCKVT